MELSNFGAIMKFAIDREEDLREVFTAASKSSKLASMHGEIAELAKRCSKNLQLLERTRRENVCEMVLQPITGLNPVDYLFQSPPASEMSEGDFRTFLEGVNSKMARFYKDAADKLSIDEAKGALARLAKR